MHGREPRPGSSSAGSPSEWNYAARGETELQQPDRHFTELLQELRVAQIGVQILFAFLLGLALTPRFPEMSTDQRAVYLARLVLAATSAALLIAPVSYHRMVFRRRLRAQLVGTAHRYVSVGLLFLLLALVGAVHLAAGFVLGPGAAVLAAVLAGSSCRRGTSSRCSTGSGTGTSRRVTATFRGCGHLGGRPWCRRRTTDASSARLSSQDAAEASSRSAREIAHPARAERHELDLTRRPAAWRRRRGPSIPTGGAGIPDQKLRMVRSSPTSSRMLAWPLYWSRSVQPSAWTVSSTPCALAQNSQAPTVMSRRLSTRRWSW
jgi:hypothetical protein